MDISYLLFLQEIRNSLNDAGASFFVGMSTFSVTYLFLLPAFIYWCISKRNGLYIFASTYLCIAMSAVIKLIACRYRPWVRDPRIVPVVNSLARATGYSFPSGHITTATPIYGGMANSFWANKATRWFSFLCIAALLVTAFSRNYLGVHTTQDVLVGLILGVCALWAVHVIFKHIKRHPEHENYFLAAGIVLGLMALTFVTLKPYPLDYIDGELLVDPQQMMNDAYKDICYLIAFCAARYVEKRWINFTHTGWNGKGIILSIAGLIPLALLFAYGGKWFIQLSGPHWGRALFAFAIVFYIIAGYPLVIKWFTQQTKSVVDPALSDVK